MGVVQAELVGSDGVSVAAMAPVARVPVTVEGQWAARLCPYGLGPRRAAWVAGFLAGWVGGAEGSNPWRVEGLRSAWECGLKQGMAQGATV